MSDDTTYQQPMLFSEDSHAKTSPLPGSKRGSKKAPVPAFGSSSPVLLANYDHVSSFWRTYQPLLEMAERSLLETLPRWGMMLSGALYQLPQLALPTDANDGTVWPTPRTLGLIGGSGSKEMLQRAVNTGAPIEEIEKMAGLKLFPTPVARDWKVCGTEPSEQARKSPCLPATIQMLAPSEGILNPSWVEQLMGYPDGWTQLEENPGSPRPLVILKVNGKRRAQRRKCLVTMNGLKRSATP